jgi:hypothetical protein
MARLKCRFFLLKSSLSRNFTTCWKNSRLCAVLIGQDFTVCWKTRISALLRKAATSQLARDSRFCSVLKGHDFSRAAKSLTMSAALAAEGWFCISALTNRLFQQAVSRSLTQVHSSRAATQIRAILTLHPGAEPHNSPVRQINRCDEEGGRNNHRVDADPAASSLCTRSPRHPCADQRGRREGE